MARRAKAPQHKILKELDAAVAEALGIEGESREQVQREAPRFGSASLASWDRLNEWARDREREELGDAVTGES